MNNKFKLIEKFCTYYLLNIIHQKLGALSASLLLFCPIPGVLLTASLQKQKQKKWMSDNYVIRNDAHIMY